MRIHASYFSELPGSVESLYIYGDNFVKIYKCEKYSVIS